MTGRAEVESLKRRLDSTFKRASNVGDDAELMSDFARHLCVLVSGFLEQAVIELLLEYVRQRTPQEIQRHVGQRLRRFSSASAGNLGELLGSFDLDWQRSLELFVVDEYKDAVDSVVGLRYTIAHGKFAGVTIASVQSYYDRVKKVIEHIADLCLPT
jgi:hypothetical protein